MHSLQRLFGVSAAAGARLAASSKYGQITLVEQTMTKLAFVRLLLEAGDKANLGGQR